MHFVCGLTPYACSMSTDNIKLMKLYWPNLIFFTQKERLTPWANFHHTNTTASFLHRFLPEPVNVERFCVKPEETVKLLEISSRNMSTTSRSVHPLLSYISHLQPDCDSNQIPANIFLKYLPLLSTNALDLPQVQLSLHDLVFVLFSISSWA